MKNRVSSAAFRCCRLIHPAITLALGLNCKAIDSLLNAPPALASFEAPDYHEGSVDGQRGWSVQQGKAEVIGDQAHSGKRSLKLFPANPFSQAKLTLTAPLPPASVMFVDFHVRPVATIGSVKGEMLDIDGARIGFFRDENDANKGKFWVFHGDGAGSGAWLATGTSVPIDEKGTAANWVRLTLREDFARQLWDVRVDGVLAGANLGFQESQVPHAESYIIMGDASEAVYLDDLGIDRGNPLCQDSDADGFGDADEKKAASNPYFDDRDDDHDGDGFTVLETAAASGPSVVGEPEPVLPASPQFSVPGGIIRESVSLAISGRPEGGSLFYTTDGSDPRVTGRTARRYEHPLEIRSTAVVRAIAVDRRGRAGSTVTTVFIFPADVTGQKCPADASSAFTDRSFWHGVEDTFPFPWHLTGSEPDIGILPHSLLEAPIVVIAASPWDLFDPVRGVYSRSSVKAQAAGEMIILPPGKACTPGMPASVSITGQSSRFHDVSVKHSLRLRFPAGGWDGGALGFPPGPLEQLRLRHPTHDSWALSDLWASNRRHAKYLADAWANRWMQKLGHPYLIRRFVHVFLNGSYWGVYEAMEQQDSGYQSRHQGESDSKLSGPVANLIEPDPSTRNGVAAIVGSPDAWIDVRSRLLGALNAEREGAGSEKVWAALRSEFDTTNLIDYIAGNCWAANMDWPERNWLAQARNGIWQFPSWDAEYSLRRVDGLTNNNVERLSNAVDGPAFVFCALIHSAPFREEVRRRLDWLLADGGALHPIRLTEEWSALAATLRPLIVGEAARWGGVYSRQPLTAEMWEREVQWLQAEYIPKRSDIVRDQFATWLKRIDENAKLRAEGKNTGLLTTGPKPPGPVRPFGRRAEFYDTDGDGMPDEWEKAHGFDSQDRSDGLADKDGDGLNNLTESLLGTDPAQLTDRLAHTAESPAGVVATRLTVRVPRRSLHSESNADSLARSLRRHGK